MKAALGKGHLPERTQATRLLSTKGYEAGGQEFEVGRFPYGKLNLQLKRFERNRVLVIHKAAFIRNRLLG